jgi:hypothetical protein
LEVKPVVGLRERNSDLEAQLHQERRTMSRMKRTPSEGERKKSESKSESEDHGVDLKHRLEMRIVQDTEVSRTEITAAVSNTEENQWSGKQRHRPSTTPELSVRSNATGDSPRVQDTEQERLEAEKIWKETEKQLWSRIEVLEALTEPMNAKIQIYKESEDTYKKRIAELENELQGMKRDTQGIDVNRTLDTTGTDLDQLAHVSSVECREVEYMKKCEGDMKKRINELEMKESAYLEKLHQAHEQRSEMENSYKMRIANAEDNEAAMRGTVRKLEEKLRQVFQRDEENEMLLDKLQDMEKSEMIYKKRIRILEAEKNQLAEERNQLRDALQSMQTELEKTKEMVAGPLKEELLKERKLSRTLQEEITKLERDMRDTSNAHQTQVSAQSLMNCR